MSNRDLHFRGQMENEEVITFFRKHWIVLLRHMVPFALYVSIITVVLINIPQFQLPSLEEPFFLLIVLLVIGGTGYLIHNFFVNMVEHFMNIFIITNQRLVIVNKTLFIRDDKESLDMKKVQDIQKQQEGLVKNFLHFGELIISMSSAEPRTLTAVPNPDYHFRLLNRLRDRQFATADEAQVHRLHKTIKDTQSISHYNPTWSTHSSVKKKE